MSKKLSQHLELPDKRTNSQGNSIISLELIKERTDDLTRTFLLKSRVKRDGVSDISDVCTK